MDDGRAERLDGTGGAAMPAFSPDGTSVWFFAGGSLRRLDLAGGGIRDVAGAPAAAGVSVRAGDDVLFAPGPGAIVRLAGGTRTDVTRLRDGERAHLFPAWTGRGDAFVYLALHDDGRRTIRLREGDLDVELRRADSHGVVARDHLLHVRDTTLVAEPLDYDRRALGRQSITLAAGVGIAPGGRGAFAVSDRLLAWGPPASRPRVIGWFDAASGEPRGTIAEPGDYWQVRLSPDERTVAVTARDPLVRTLDVFTAAAGGGPLLRRTLALAADTDPVWSPDGRRIAFRSFQDGSPQLFVLARGASPRDEPLHRSPLDEMPSDWSRDGVIFHARSADTAFDIWRVAPGAEAAEAIVRSGFNERDGRVSPDGRWLAYASDESGRFDVYVSRLRGGARTRVSTAGGERPRWIAGGRAIVFLRGEVLMRADLAIGAGAPVASVPVAVMTLPGVRDYAISADGGRVLAILPDAGTAVAGAGLLAGWAALLR
jgi:Tol biopolymer transport system component